MKRERKRYDGTLKAKVALEAIKGQRTINEIASAYGIHPNQATQWKKQALEQLPEIFWFSKDKNTRQRDHLK